MNPLGLLALLLTISGWVLVSLTGMHLLSGYMESRSCQTDCVQTLFYAAIALGAVGLLLSFAALIRPRGRSLSVLSLLLALPLCAIFTTLFLIGNYA
jgi:hypothetical protein